MIDISDRAISQIKTIMRNENRENNGLRIGIKGGGCSGFTYVMDFEENPGDNDQIYNINDVNVVIDSKSVVYLQGTELDFTDGLNGSGFIFKNPNATRSCGCGSSFAV
ncbi:MAG: iron-sulfur cluster insertion protein ErpA [Caldithrix sp.]|nr:iron-sulfur cluster insertion protein ErpA [Caldithrix sp.]